jgi:hypothetical protein
VAGLVGVKSNILNHRPLRQRFRSALCGAVLWLPPQAVTKLPILIEATILEQSRVGMEQDLRVLNAIAIGLWQHQDLSALPSYFMHLDDLVVALLIALACRDALNPKTAIADINNVLRSTADMNFASPQQFARLEEQLQNARALVEQGASGAIARAVLIPKSDEFSDRCDLNIAYGLYCWLSTPYDWHLATQRAQQVQPELGAKIGAIAAAYNGYIPPGDAQIVETGIAMADRLLAAWAGVCDLRSLDPDFYAAIVAPDILGKRL